MSMGKLLSLCDLANVDNIIRKGGKVNLVMTVCSLVVLGLWIVVLGGKSNSLWFWVQVPSRSE